MGKDHFPLPDPSQCPTKASVVYKTPRADWMWQGKTLEGSEQETRLDGGCELSLPASLWSRVARGEPRVQGFSQRVNMFIQGKCRSKAQSVVVFKGEMESRKASRTLPAEVSEKGKRFSRRVAVGRPTGERCVSDVSVNGNNDGITTATIYLLSTYDAPLSQILSIWAQCDVCNHLYLHLSDAGSKASKN